MITSKTRAVVLLGATLVVGVVLGSLVSRLRHDEEGAGGRRRGSPGTGWLRDYHPDSLLMARLDSAWAVNTCITDSITRARIGAQSESLMVSFRPVLDSLRGLNRAGMRSLLPDSLRAKYDSLNAADDSNRTKQWAQRDNRGGACSEAWTRWNNRDARGNGPPGGGRGGRGTN